MNKYEVTYEYHYEDSETVTVFAEDEVEARQLADDEREGPNYAYDHAMVTYDEVYAVDFIESDVDHE